MQKDHECVAADTATNQEHTQANIERHIHQQQEGWQGHQKGPKQFLASVASRGVSCFMLSLSHTHL